MSSSSTDPRYEQLLQKINAGYDAMEPMNAIQACQEWLAAWELFKEMIPPNVRSLDELGQAAPHLHEDYRNWQEELMFELWNAGIGNPAYHERRLEYIDEFLTRFPDENDIMQLNFGRGRGESLWALGRKDEAEAAFSNLVEQMPDQGWGYIGWSDEYWLGKNSAKDYARAETILKGALEQPTLEDRMDVLERLVDLYAEWGKEKERLQTRMEMNRLKRSSDMPASPAYQASETPTKKKGSGRGKRKKKSQ